ncbi:MAG TPA: DUF962 domain-containing protein [Acetobacteraceae bacterium]|jgi:hypothetical protein|nr:DUF962 domain-containing protein [Acetobacteraceae bacterium]
MTYDEFWLRYLRAHSRSKTRALHYAGTGLALVTLLVGIATLNWRSLIAAPMIGYTFAWTAHFAVERNRPETFGHPFWSLFSDLRMLLLAVGFRLAPHLQRAGLRT